MATAVAGVAPRDRTFLERRFKVRELGSTVGTELKAGLATYLTMCYILFVNAGIMSSVADHNGLKLGFVAVMTVTALVAGVMTIAMGLHANRPFALATGLGLNAFLAFTLVGTVGLTWPEASGVIVAEGALITLAMYTGLREIVIKAIPDQLKTAIGIGIGLFLATIGLVSAGIVVGGDEPIVHLAPQIDTWPLTIFVGSLVVTGAMVARGMKSALLLGIILTTAVATLVNWANDYTVFQTGARFPDSWISPDFGLLGNFSFSFVSTLSTWTAIAVVLSVLLSDFFDTAGTVTGISKEAGMVDRDGNPSRLRQILRIDSFAALAGGLSGNSSNTTFIESESGVATGGRTGLTSMVVGVLFLLSLGLAPIAGMVPAVATAPILVIIGVKMFRLVGDIDRDDMVILIPAFATMILMPLTYSITNGVGAGFVLFVALCLLTGQWRRVHWLMYPLALIFVWYFYHGVV